MMKRFPWSRLAQESLRIFCFVLTFHLLWGVVSTAFATIEIESVLLGVGSDQFYKRDRWAPLQVIVTSQNEAFAGEIRVEVRNVFSGELIQGYTTPLSLTRTDRQHRVLYVFLPGTSTQVTLKLMNSAGQIRLSLEIPPELPKQAIDLVVLALTPNRDVLTRWSGKPIEGDGHLFVTYTDLDGLPTDWQGYDSVDLFVVRGASLAASRISEQQQGALLDWIQRGGTLIVSGGADFHSLRGSFLEPFLPVDLVALRTTTELPEALERFGFDVASPFDWIEFTPKPGVQPLLDSGNRVPVVKRAFGSGQIISLAFDYNAPPFSESPGAEAFWRWIFKTEGRSPRHAGRRYEADRRHAEKLQTLLMTLPSTQAPLIQFLAVFLSVYALSLGGLTWWAGKRRGRGYWMGGALVSTFFFGGVLFARHLVPGSVSIHRFSVLSVYPERNRAYVQTYMGLLASARSEASIRFQGDVFVKPLTPYATPPLNLVEARDFQLRRTDLDPWVTRGYSAESFIDFPIGRSRWRPVGKTGGEIEHHFPRTLENTWLIDRGRYTYLASVPPDTVVEFEENSATRQRSPFPQELSGTRRQFVQILVSEGVLLYLMQEEKPKLIGWTQHSFLPMTLNHPVRSTDDTLVILYLVN